ncbi:MAG: hypothetical protein ACM3S1_09055 [Hyphomicrobiales bacterium]
MADDDPLFEAGAQYLLFLDLRPGDLYVVLGGPQGRFVVTNGQVSSLSAVYPDRNIGDLKLSGVALADIAARVGG